jgi:hypothetical protein
VFFSEEETPLFFFFRWPLGGAEAPRKAASRFSSDCELLFDLFRGEDDIWFLTVSKNSDGELKFEMNVPLGGCPVKRADVAPLHTSRAKEASRKPGAP